MHFFYEILYIAADETATIMLVITVVLLKTLVAVIFNTYYGSFNGGLY